NQNTNFSPGYLLRQCSKDELQSQIFYPSSKADGIQKVVSMFNNNSETKNVRDFEIRVLEEDFESEPSLVQHESATHFDLSAILDSLLIGNKNAITFRHQKEDLYFNKCNEQMRNRSENDFASDNGGQLSFTSNLLKLDTRGNAVRNGYLRTVFIKNQDILDEIVYESNKTAKDYRKIGFYFSKLVTNNKFKQGIAFHNSSVSIGINISNFCFYSTFCQYDEKGTQILLEVKNNNCSFQIKMQNGRLLKKIKHDKVEEIFLFENHSDILNIGLHYINKYLKIFINGFWYGMDINDITLIKIGTHFRGVVSKILIYEHLDYDEKYFAETSPVHYYVKYIKNLEKILRYKNLRMCFIAGKNPFQLKKEFPITMENVVENNNFNWMENREFLDFILNKSAHDEKYLSIVEKWVGVGTNGIE
ncbi:hypothetical protein EQH57_0663, partial [Dictyocoela roeselum]